jgi:RecA/RadA recombinase
MSLMERLKKNSKIKEASVLETSSFFNEKDMIPTHVHGLNIALGGSLKGGLQPGLLQVAGPSKHFKTGISLIMVRAYLEKYPDAVLMFYDSEFGAPQSYFEANKIDTSRVLHCPITDIEQLKFDIMSQLEEVKRGDKVIFMIDSIGNLASKKEVEDALNEKSVADMTRAKQLKSLFRMVTPHLTLKDIPMIVINHTYKEIGLFPKDIVGGGCLGFGEKIQMADGTLREIQEVQVGELVRTTLGAKEVTHVWDPKTLLNGTPECYEIQFEDGHTVVCSENHKFLVSCSDGSDRWIEAKDLTEEMDIIQF